MASARLRGLGKEAGQLVFQRDISSPEAPSPSAIALSTLSGTGTFYVTSDGVDRVVPVSIDAMKAEAATAPLDSPFVVVVQAVEGTENLAVLTALLTSDGPKPMGEMVPLASQSLFERTSGGEANEADEAVDTLRQAADALWHHALPGAEAIGALLSHGARELGGWFAEGMFDLEADPTSPLQLAQGPAALLAKVLYHAHPPGLAEAVGKTLWQAGQRAILHHGTHEIHETKRETSNPGLSFVASVCSVVEDVSMDQRLLGAALLAALVPRPRNTRKKDGNP